MFRPLLLAAVLSSALQAAPVFEPLQAFAKAAEFPDCPLVLGADGNFYGTSRAGGPDGSGCFFRLTPDGHYTLLGAFGGAAGSEPNGVIAGPDGNFYGTALSGGEDDQGTVFRATLSGQITPLVTFNGGNGSRPPGGLVLGQDGHFYGTTSSGGSSGGGTVFQVRLDGNLWPFIEFGEGNSTPSAALIQGRNGMFYGTTTQGGENGGGTVFVVSPPSNYFPVAALPPAPSALTTFSTLVQTADGSFYGTCGEGGMYGYGYLFKVTNAGDFTHVVDFTAASGTPAGRLLETADGSLWGTAIIGGSHSAGTIFRITPARQLKVVYNFDPARIPGANPLSGLTSGPDGDLYGMASSTSTDSPLDYHSGTFFKITPRNGRFTHLLTFADTGSIFPNGALVQDRDGSFLGTSNEGAADSLSGTVFRISPERDITSLVQFDVSNGAEPLGGLTAGGDGFFYGTTRSGGSKGQGSFYRVNGRGDFSSLAGFGAPGPSQPNGLVRGKDGNFYGTAGYGTGYQSGAFFKVTRRGQITPLAPFTPTLGGSMNFEPLLQAADGNFYGVGAGLNGLGGVYRATPAGALSSVVDFQSGTSPGQPSGGLTAGPDGWFYGVTPTDIFRVNPAGTLQNIATFPFTEGGAASRLLLAADGNFYGSTFEGGTNHQGSLFRVTPGGELTLLHSFEGPDGAQPYGVLVQGRDGHLYGTTRQGGTTPEGCTTGGGQFFRLRLGAEATTLPADGVTSGSAVLHASVDPGPYSTAVSFQYGLDAQLRRFVTLKAGTLPGGDPRSVALVLPHLMAGRTYYFRVVTANAENSVPQAAGIQSFTTPRRQPAGIVRPE